VGANDSLPAGPDLARGVPADSLAEGQCIVGRVGQEAALLTRSGGACFALGATCTHYGAPLADGLVHDGTIRCPWHHARFSLATGEATCAPALDPIASWEVEERDGLVFVGARRVSPEASGARDAIRVSDDVPSAIVIIGAGAAGNAAAEMLRRTGYQGSLTMVGAENDLPYDRPNLSKDFLAGSASAEWIPLRSPEFYAQHAIDVISSVRATDIDTRARHVTLRDGRRLPYDRLLLATGSTPIRLHVRGCMSEHVHYLRSLADCRALITAAEGARRAVVVGASFIGLEVAAALRARGIGVDVVGLEERPLERILGPEFGRMIQELHESHGVVFHLRNTITAIDDEAVVLAHGGALPADLVVIGVGVRPQLALAESAGLALDRGVEVNEYLETSVPGIFAVGDIARWPDPHTGEHIRVEHWVVAERQGQTAAINMLAGTDGSTRKAFDAVPYFWSRHYDTSISYIGHAEHWDRITVEGDLQAHDATVTFHAGARRLAVATVGRDKTSLELEASMEDALSAANRGWPDGATSCVG
jgi:NADPH-dependent 2,4-dienoyl-CoA reductase/sulfur reductase-like enzyme/nitrite reductase/ring-hydroxylating ferredoxin subunit